MKINDLMMWMARIMLKINVYPPPPPPFEFQILYATVSMIHIIHTVIVVKIILLSSQFTHPKFVPTLFNNKVLARSLKKFDYNRHV